MFRNWSIIACLAGLLTWGVTGAQAQQYTITNLATLQGCSGCEANAISDGGQVVGYAFAYNDNACLWQNGTAGSLGLLELRK